MPRHQDCKQRLIETAFRLFGTRGYHNTSIADILRESGCKRGTLYHYFSSKEQLGYAVIDEAMRLLVEQGSVSPLRSDGHPIDRMVKTLETLPDLVQMGSTVVATSDITVRMTPVHAGFREYFGRRTEALVQPVEEMVRKGVADGQIADSVDPDELSHLFVTVCIGIQFSKLMWKREVIWEDTSRWLRQYLSSLRR